MLLWLFIWVLLIFRWKLLAPVIGAVRMFLFDALLWTCWGAWMFAAPGAIVWLGYGLGGLSLVFAYQSASKYLKYSELVRIENEQRKSNSGPTAGR